MARTNIDIDEEACALVMRQRGLTTKREAVNYALRKAAIVPFTIEEILALPPIDIYDVELDEIAPAERLGYLVEDRGWRLDEARHYLRDWGVEFVDIA